MPQVTIPSKGSTTLVAPKIPKGMTVLLDIMPQLQNLSFEDVDTSKLIDINRKNYMKLVKDTPDSPNWFVAMQWVKGLLQYGLLSLLFMPYFGRSS